MYFAFAAATLRNCDIQNAIMAGAQKGTEFALCLNSCNRDVQAYPNTNDFRLELLDRYDMQMMVLGSLELPYTQFLIEEPWSTFSYDVGLSLYSLMGRSLQFHTPSGVDDNVVLLPAPYLPVVCYGGPTSTIYESVGLVQHGLGPSSLDCFAPESVRIFLVPPDTQAICSSSPFEVLTVTEILSPTQVQVANAAKSPRGYGLLVVTEANTRTFRSPESLVSSLRSFCGNPFPGREYLRRLRFTYNPAIMVLSLEIAEPCASMGSEHQKQLSVNLHGEANLLTSLGFYVPRVPHYVLGSLCSDFPVRRSCVQPPRLEAIGLPLRPNYVRYTSNNPPKCERNAKEGPPCPEPGMCVQQIQIPCGNYEWPLLQRVTEHKINNRAFLDIPSPTPSVDLIKVYAWGTALQTDSFMCQSASSFHPAGIAKHLNLTFSTLNTPLVWTYEEDRFVIRPLHPNTIFRIVWPSGEHSQMLPQRFRIDDNIMFATEIKGSTLHYCPSPTHISLPSSHGDMQISMTKRYIFSTRPKLIPGGAALLQNIPVQVGIMTGEHVIQIDIGALPLETPVLVYNPSDITDACFGFVACNSTADDTTFIVLLSHGNSYPPITTTWRVAALPMRDGACNLYFPPAQGKCWSRLAEIYGFPSGATLWMPPALVAPWHWNLEQPSYLLLDLGLQHVSATITHRCGNNVLSGFFGKIVLYPPFKEMRMTPIQAMGTGVSVVSSLHLRLLNPWHQLYELHGRNWSITVILASNTKGARTDCL